MAELVKEENALVALKVSLDNSGDMSSAPMVAFEVDHGGQALETYSVSAEELGVPPDFNAASHRYGEPDFSLPADLISRLHGPIDSALGQQGDDEPILWLHLASPAGFLPLLPWERMLRPGFTTPILRVPNFALFPSFEVDVIDIVLCASEPAAKSSFGAARHLVRIAESLIEELPFEVAVHVFADAQTYGSIRRMGDHLVGERPGGSLVLYDPDDAPRPSWTWGTSETSTGDDPVASPWLDWISNGMSGRTVDAVHFLTHSYVYGDQPSLAVAESPTSNDDRVWSRFIGPGELSAFLGRIGAWAVGTSSPPHGYSPMATRLLGERLAHMRAGPILLHDFRDDPEGLELVDAYIGLFQQKRPTQSSSVGLYCHPRVFSGTAPSDRMPYAEQLVVDSIGSTRTPHQAPSWVVLATRNLEQSASRLFPDQDEPSSDVDRAAGEGVKAALSFVQGVMERVGEGGYFEAAAAADTSEETTKTESDEAMA